MNIIEQYKDLRAFHGQPEVKELYVSRVKAHAAADEIIHGQYWAEGKGCAVGCTIHSGRHEAYETELGIPEAIAHLEDCLFESLSNGDAKNLPLRFIEAIPVGADLSMVIPQFLYWLFADETFGLFVATKKSPEDVKLAVNGVGELYRRVVSGEIPAESEWDEAGNRAWDAWDARAAWAARDAWAAWAAWAARDAWDAWDARAARAARAAWAARDAWDARAAWDAWDARAAWDAWDAFRKASSEKLLELLAAAPVKEEVTA